MDLWIRSQEKERLIKPTDLYIEETIDYENECSEFDIYALNYANNDIRIGTYQTKERALEILEEIQNILVGTIIIKSNALFSPSERKKLRERFNIDKLPIIKQPSYEIEPLQNFIVYKMPEE